MLGCGRKWQRITQVAGLTGALVLGSAASGLTQFTFYVGEGSAAVPELVGLLREEAKVL